MPTLSACIIAAINDVGNDQEKHEKLVRNLQNMFEFFNKYLGKDNYKDYQNQDGKFDFANGMRSKSQRTFDLEKVREKLKEKNNIVDTLMGDMFQDANEKLSLVLPKKQFHNATKDEFKHQKNELEDDEDRIKKIKDLRDFWKALNYFNEFKPADDKKIIPEHEEEINRGSEGEGMLEKEEEINLEHEEEISLEHDGKISLEHDGKISLKNDKKGRLENGIEMLETCISDNCLPIFTPMYKRFLSGMRSICVSGWASSNSDEYWKMISKSEAIVKKFSKDKKLPSIGDLKAAHKAAEEYRRRKRQDKGRPEEDEGFQPWSPSGKARYNGAKTIMDATEELLRFVKKVSGKEDVKKVSGKEDLHEAADLINGFDYREQQRKDARKLPEYETMSGMGLTNSLLEAWGLYESNSDTIALRESIDIMDSEKIQNFQPKDQNIVRTSGKAARTLIDNISKRVSSINKIRNRVNSMVNSMEEDDPRRLRILRILSAQKLRALKSLGNEPLYDVIKDKAKLYRHMMTIKKVLEKDPTKFASQILSLKECMEELIPPKKYRQTFLHNMDQLFSETVADQIADEQYRKFYNAKKNNKSVDVVKKNCAAKILAVNILKKVYKDNGDKAYPSNSPLNVDVLFSAKNIKEVAKKIKDTEWFKEQTIDTLEENVVEPGVINDNVFNNVVDVIHDVQENLDYYITANEEQKEHKLQGIVLKK